MNAIQVKLSNYKPNFANLPEYRKQHFILTEQYFTKLKLYDEELTIDNIDYSLKLSLNYIYNNPDLESEYEMYSISNYGIIQDDIDNLMKEIGMEDAKVYGGFAPTTRRVVLNGGGQKRVVYKRGGKGDGYVKVGGEFVNLKRNYTRISGV